MNNERRKRLATLDPVFEDAQALIEEIRDEEQEAFDNLPQSLQEGERGQTMQEAIDALESALESVGLAAESVEEASA